MIGLGQDRHGKKDEGTPLGRILWFVGFWLAGLAVIGTIAYGIRSVLL